MVAVAGILEDGLEPRTLVFTVKDEGNALPAGTPGAPDAVQVVFVLIGDLVVKGGVHLLHIDAAGGNVGGDQHIEFVIAVGRHDAVARGLLHIAIEALGTDTRLLQVGHQTDGAVLGVAEHHATAVFLPL